VGGTVGLGGYRLLMRSTRERLSVRLGAAPVPALVEGVPPSLESALREWIRGTAALDPAEASHVLIRLDLVLPGEYVERYRRQVAEQKARQAELDAQWKAAREARRARGEEEDGFARFEERPFVPAPVSPYVLFLAQGTPTDVLWDLVDDLLGVFGSEPPAPGTSPLFTWFNADDRRARKITESLGRLLAESRSVYEIAPDRRGLRRRMPASLGDAFAGACVAAETGGYADAQMYLTLARDKLFALRPDPSGAYVEMIRAVEAVACPLFARSDRVPTLGKVLAHLRDAGAKYEYVLTDKSGTRGTTEGVVGMIRDLWEGHSDRHAGGPKCIPVAQEPAEAGLTIATALVTLFSRGAVRLRT